VTEAVVFDLDGTLVDTPAGIAEALHDVVLAAGVQPPSTTELRLTIGRPLPEVMPQLIGSTDEARVEEAIEHYRELFSTRIVPHAPRLVVPGVIAGLAALQAAGVAVAVATSKARPAAKELLDGAGLAAYFDVVICTDMVSRGKPHPEIALAAVAALGVDPAHGAMVGDTVEDMQVGVGAGLRPIGVSYGVGDRPTLLAAGAVLVADSFPEVIRAVTDGRAEIAR
jgi:phosphoglycolate phosphatase